MLFFLDSLVLLDVVIQVAVILVCCGSKVCRIGDDILRAGCVEVNIELGVCLKNITEQESNYNHL